MEVPEEPDMDLEDFETIFPIEDNRHEDPKVLAKYHEYKIAQHESFLQFHKDQLKELEKSKD